MAGHFKADGEHVTDEFSDLMLKLAAAWPTTGRLTPPQICVWARALRDVPFKALQSACGRAVQECEYFPTVAKLRSYVEPSASDAGLVAWSALDRAARDVGAWASVTVDDPCAAEALTIVFGSWPEFCAFDDGPALGARRQQFLAAYAEARRRFGRKALPRTLRGLVSLDAQMPQSLVGRIETSGRVLVERPTRRGIALDGNWPRSAEIVP